MGGGGVRFEAYCEPLLSKSCIRHCPTPLYEDLLWVRYNTKASVVLPVVNHLIHCIAERSLDIAHYK